MLKLSSGPTGAPSKGMLGSLQHQRLQRRLLLAQLAFQLAGLRARPPWPWRPSAAFSSGAALLNRALIALRSARSASISVLSPRTSPSSAEQRVEIERRRPCREPPCRPPRGWP